ncbi:putative dehydrogenase [Paenibacillus phyllosphaerae]|uniref:Putative dehydrogenase n=1 Tax=Paenibacillus phyllosphaerae TaxID=274593 RepID=A0A7W5AY98_9BACL|nr:Gfo/Idh/MocA family oxidoreductase [Paenibacillus phyllosphaerae]MBB3110985.1 putative dehydrogenase [Paenibacillus phyllosphaerae]
MLKIGLIGFGFMGRMHMDNYVRLMAEGEPIQLTAICDIRIHELKNSKAPGNIATDREVYDLSAFNLYEDIEQMLHAERLDVIDITLPTPLHADLSCRLMERGYHVLCEKPIARTYEGAVRMAETASRTGRQLLIGQCLRYWPAYEFLKDCVDDQRFGGVHAGTFYRGSESPQGWFLNGELSGGCLLDMHIHDTDMIHWLFGMPDRVSAAGKNVIAGSGYDIVRTQYAYPDGKLIDAQADWTYAGEHGFIMGYRVNFEHGMIVFERGEVRVYPSAGEAYTPELSSDTGYYRMIRAYMHTIRSGEPNLVCPADSAAGSLKIIEAEQHSADRASEWVLLQLASGQ